MTEALRRSRRPRRAPFREGVLWRLLSHGFRAQGRRYAIALGAMVLVAASAAATAWSMEHIVDAMSDPADRRRIYAVALMVVAIFTVKGVATYVQLVYLSRAGNRIVSLYQSRIYDRMLRQGVAFFNASESSDLQMRLNMGAQSARGVINLVATSMVRDLLTLAGLLGVMIYQQPVLSAISLVAGPIALLGIRLILRRVQAIMEKEMLSMAEIIKVLQETSGGIQIIKIFSLESRMEGRMTHAVGQVEQRANAIARLEAVTSPLMETLSGFAIAGVVIVSAVGVMGGTPTTPGQLMSFITALLMAYEPAKRLSRMRVSLEVGMVGVRMMFDLLDRPQTMVEAPDARPLAPGPGRVALEGVSFGYREAAAVIDGLDLVFEAGRTTALVGPSGGGKSTILNLMMRLYDPVEGRVTFDGQDLRGLTYASLRGQISFVGQDTFLFSTSVRDNIRCSRLDATDAEVEQAARDAHAHEFIAALPQGYDTAVGENGAFLSGGQRQRLSIARAVLRRPRVLLLDEATSALDASSEAMVRDALDRITAGVTTIVIAHRLSTILKADRICVLREGRLLEHGTARELLAREGAFRTLFDQQFGPDHADAAMGARDRDVA